MRQKEVPKHTGEPDCPACESSKELGKAMIDLINTSDLSNMDRMTALLNAVACGFDAMISHGETEQQGTELAAAILSMLTGGFASVMAQKHGRRPDARRSDGNALDLPPGTFLSPSPKRPQ